MEGQKKNLQLVPYENWNFRLHLERWLKSLMLAHQAAVLVERLSKIDVDYDAMI